MPSKKLLKHCQFFDQHFETDKADIVFKYVTKDVCTKQEIIQKIRYDKPTRSIYDSLLKHKAEGDDIKKVRRPFLFFLFRSIPRFSSCVSPRSVHAAALDCFFRLTTFPACLPACLPVCLPACLACLCLSLCLSLSCSCLCSLGVWVRGCMLCACGVWRTVERVCRSARQDLHSGSGEANERDRLPEAPFY